MYSCLFSLLFLLLPFFIILYIFTFTFTKQTNKHGKFYIFIFATLPIAAPRDKVFKKRKKIVSIQCSETDRRR